MGFSFAQKSIAVLLMVVTLSVLLPAQALADNWVKARVSDKPIWVDTSHWETYQEWVSSGYWEPYAARRWVSSGYWQPYTERRWVDTSHWELVGYGRRWVDTSHWEAYTAYRSVWYVGDWHYVGSHRHEYFWGEKTLRQWWVGHTFWTYWQNSSGTGTIYYKRFWEPSGIPHGWYSLGYYWQWRGWIQQAYTAYRWVHSGYWQTYPIYRWVQSGYWQYYTAYRWIDTSHWETYTAYRWIDTSHWETRQRWVASGYWASPLHGTVTVSKKPKYVFTKWHKLNSGDPAHLDIDISWDTNKPISEVLVYHDVNRHQGKGTERVYLTLPSRGINPPRQAGRASFRGEYEHAGDKSSTLYIVIKAADGSTATIYGEIPINGFRSILARPEYENIPLDSWEGSLREAGSVSF